MNPRRRLPSDYQTLRDASESGDLLTLDNTNVGKEGTPASSIIDPMILPPSQNAELHEDIHGCVAPSIECPSETTSVSEVVHETNYDCLDSSIFTFNDSEYGKGYT